MLTFRAVLIGALVLGACHHKSAQTTPEVAANPTPSTTVAPPPPQPVSTNLRAGDELVKRCELQFDNRSEAPKFEFDRFELTTQDRDVLQQIADCVTKGPLKGRKLQLVGRADPRGTEEYNLGLGDKRAHSVGDYLHRLGVDPHAIAASTRGAIDATGNDDASWRVDRRVDVDLD
jgi:peptidoglycan-associated lipoprotein